MELRQLRYLVALADERHFTRAAARLRVAQPALSQQIRKLERELGVPLFDRTTRSVRLTEAGELLVVRARRVLAEIEDAGEELRELAGVVAGRVTIGMSQTPGPFDVVGLLAGFHASFPDVELAMREDLSVSLAGQLRAGELDVAFLTIVDEPDTSGLTVHPLAVEELLVVLAPGHPLAGRERLAVDELREEEFVSFPRGATIRRAVERRAREAGFEPRTVFETSEVSRTRALVSGGLGVAVLPRSDALAIGPPVAVAALEGPTLTHRVSLCWREGRRHSPATRAFIERARG
ncbi:MAG TPA: LysR substrate-binding domain-containing protein [Conexibacter sp.]|jgi:DNA-binding transcriptional LysR family regulator